MKNQSMMIVALFVFCFVALNLPTYAWAQDGDYWEGPRVDYWIGKVSTDIPAGSSVAQINSWGKKTGVHFNVEPNNGNYSAVLEEGDDGLGARCSKFNIMLIIEFDPKTTKSTRSNISKAPICRTK